MERQKVGLKRLFSDSTCVDSNGSDPQVPEVDKEVASNIYTVAKGSSGEYLSCYLMNSCGSTNTNKYYIV
jgi:hypothetical protein